ncbi:lipoyl synthase [Caldicellulosiruptor changbaiensis]|uniref:lipoyl synthase n=1 Tax=Caldicellulosiruptor changbaiensis TaxID=1222016 RepID=UPI001F496C5A
MMQTQKPDWLRIRIKANQNVEEVIKLLEDFSLHTVCQEAQCPNIFECFSKKTATFLILGDVCTRNCTFCDVKKGKPQEVDKNEPQKVAEAVKALNLRYVVVTSVTRDDLEDGGAEHFANVIEKIKELNPQTKVEVLIPDFNGDEKAIYKVVRARPDVLSHNVETVPRLYPTVRPKADYERSLGVLKMAKKIDDRIYTKSGLMVGLGETKEEVKEVLKNLRSVECDFVTIGQYLSPSKQHHPVVEYIHPDIFKEYREYAISIGFRYVMSNPLVRSSYLAEEATKVFESFKNFNNTAEKSTNNIDKKTNKVISF